MYIVVQQLRLEVKKPAKEIKKERLKNTKFVAKYMAYVVVMRDKELQNLVYVFNNIRLLILDLHF